MKVILLSQAPEDISKPFATYLYDEVLAHHPHFIDIRAIIKNKSDVWLDEINASFALLSGKFVRHTRWWWVTGMSRLDARPWVQEPLFKPLLFARALAGWISQHPDIHEVTLIDCPLEVESYLKEFKNELVIERKQRNKPQGFFVMSAFKYAVIAFLKLIKNAVHVLRHHVFREGVYKKTDHLVLYESVVNTSLTSGHQFYYDGLFDDPDLAGKTAVSYGCMDSVFTPVHELRNDKDDNVFFVLDHVSFLECLKSLFMNAYLILLAVWIALDKNECRIGACRSSRFWARYLLSELSRTYLLSPICCYFALLRIFKKHKYQTVISTYEEKIIERAILFSCEEAGIPVIGYIPHPQHHLALALRDTHKPISPKPQKYAVCGHKYIDYFQSWCGKDPHTIIVWGSKKSSKYQRSLKPLDRNDLRVLMLMSHPNELRVFDSWLRSDKRLIQGVRYYFRMYRAANNTGFSEAFKLLTDHFDCIEEISGDFKENVELCDLAGFCGTSAGILAVNYGLISIHLDLDDFFEINPCFNDVDPMYSCSHATVFADRLDTICGLETDSITAQLSKEVELVDQIFSPIQKGAIERELMGVSGPLSPIHMS